MLDRLRLLPPDAVLLDRRRAAAIVLVGCLAGLGALGLIHATHAELSWPDRKISSWAYYHLTRKHLDLAHSLADLGGGPATTVVTAALIVWAYLRRTWRGAVLAVLSPIVAVTLTEHVFKPLFGRTLRGSLPNAMNYPSGHTTAAFAGIAVASLFLLRPPGRSGRRVRPMLAAVLIAVMTFGGVLVMVGLIASNYHVASDCIGGVGASIATVLGLAFAIDAAGRRLQRPRQPVVTGPVSTTSNAEPGTVLS